MNCKLRFGSKISLRLAGGLVLLMACLSSHASAQKPSGHWKFSVDALDHSGQGHHAVFHGADFSSSQIGVLLDGRSNYLEVKNSSGINVGKGDFTIATWVNTAEELDDVIGDVVSQFDPVSRTGFQLSIKNNVGVTNTQANYRNIHFGIDSGHVDGDWIDRGRPGNNVYVFSMTVFKGELYAGTCEAGEKESGRVWRLEGNDQWVDCGSPDPCNAVTSLIVYKGKLYAAASKYRLAGSALSESENLNRGGTIYRYDGEQRWTSCGKLGEAEAVFGMVEYRGQLYASAMYSPGLYRYEGGETWADCGSPDGKRVEALAVFNGVMYCTGFDEAGVYRYDGENWKDLGVLDGNTQTYGFAVYQGRLHVSSWPSGKIYRLESESQSNESRWTDVGRLGEELESMPLVVYNGKMYCGSLPLAGVFRYDEGQKWSLLGRVDLTEDVKYRRAWSMAVHKGQLFVGALPSGRVKSIEAGRNVSYDFPLKPGWRHIAAMKQGGQLKLYVDGKLVGTSRKFNVENYDLTNDKPLNIGFGQHDYFNGSIFDMRLYRTALGEEKIRSIASEVPISKE